MTGWSTYGNGSTAPSTYDCYLLKPNPVVGITQGRPLLRAPYRGRGAYQ